jgi:hypothetical protein
VLAGPKEGTGKNPLAPQGSRESATVNVVGKQVQHIRRTINCQILWTQAIHCASSQDFQSSASPFLYLIHPMVGLRKNMSQPDDAQLTHAQSLAMAVRGNVLVQQLAQFHALHVGDQQRDIIHSFRFYAQCFFYALSLSESCYFVQI